MRTKVNIVSWAVFLILLNHMSEEKSISKKISKNHHMQSSRVAYKKPIKKQKKFYSDQALESSWN